MKSSLYSSAISLLGIALIMMFVTGCHSTQVSDKPSDDMNHAMSAQQKATIAEHKKRGEQ